MKTKEELLEYAIKMRSRDDSYRSMINYLNNNCDDEEVVREIVRTVDQMEKEKKIKTEAIKLKEPLNLNLIMGGLLIVIGIGLIRILWDKGYISTLPFILIGIGLVSIAKARR